MNRLIEWGDGFSQWRDEPETVLIQIQMGDACLYNTQASLLMNEIQNEFNGLWPSKYFWSISANYGCFTLNYDAEVRYHYKVKTLTKYVEDVQDMIYSSDVVLQLHWLNESFWECDEPHDKQEELDSVRCYIAYNHALGYAPASKREIIDRGYKFLSEKDLDKIFMMEVLKGNMLSK
jgi:hypothetical protein